jgi:hypothetical protein
MSDSAADEVRVERPAMGLSHDDFFRVFPSVVAPAAWRREGYTVHVEWADGARLAATVSVQKLRRIASLSLPYVDIRFCFVGMALAERERFLTRFDRAFQKGGG